MKPVVVEAEIAAPLAKVFDVFTDLAHAPERIRAIETVEVLTPGPFAKGTRFKETRTMFGKQATETMEVADFQPGKSYAITAESHGARYRSTFEFEPVGSKTRVRLSFSATPVSFAAKMMSSMMGLMAGSVEKAIRADMEDLKAFCEGRLESP
jgi:uncharacterized membrane protein